MQQGYLFLLILLLVLPMQAICSNYAKDKPLLAYLPTALFLFFTGGCLLALLYIKTYMGILFMVLSVIFGVSAVLAFALAVFFNHRHKKLGQ